MPRVISRLRRTTVLCAALIGLTSVLSANDSVAQEREGRRSSEADSERRRSPEAEAGARKSPEAEAGPRRSPERDRDRPARGAESRDALTDFQPQTDRERALYQMIRQLQREVADLRREVRSRGRDSERPRDGDRPRRSTDRPARDEEFVLPDRWQRTKEGRVFAAYDKNGDESVSLEEWLAMTNGLVNDARREIQTKRFEDAEPSGDGKFTPAEFIYWYKIGRHKAVEGQRRKRDRADGRRRREGADRDKARDGDRPRRGPRDGEGKRRGPRDGEGERRGPRDGDAPKERAQ